MYVDVRGSVLNAWESQSIYVPSLKPFEKLEIPVYLKSGGMNAAAYQKYKNNDPSIGPLTFNVSVRYNVPDIAETAKKQGAKGTNPNRPEKYIWDKNPNYYYKKSPFIMMEKLYTGELADSVQ